MDIQSHIYLNLQASLDMAREEKEWRLAFYDSVMNNELDWMKYLVKYFKIDLNAKFIEAREESAKDSAPLHIAAKEGHIDILHYLIKKKCKLEIKTRSFGRTALHYTVLDHHIPCLNLLLSKKVNPDPKDIFGNTPCHYAAEDGAVDILNILCTTRLT